LVKILRKKAREGGQLASNEDWLVNLTARLFIFATPIASMMSSEARLRLHSRYRIVV
jgi:hypothetical protein